MCVSVFLTTALTSPMMTSSSFRRSASSSRCPTISSDRSRSDLQRCVCVRVCV